MKRLIACLLGLCLLGGVACADNLRVLNASLNAKEEYQAAYPEDTLEVLALDYEKANDGGLDELLKQGDWDVAFVSTADYDLAALAEMGLAGDWAQFPEIAQKANELYPTLRDAVTINGQLTAFPQSLASASYGLTLMGTTGQYGQEYQQRASQTLAQLGFSEVDQPATFEALCELGSHFLALPKETRKDIAFLTLEGSQSAYLLGYLLNLYERQYLDTGLCDSFDTDVFRTAMAHYAPLAKALEAEPKIKRNKDGSGTTLLRDSSQMLVNDTTFLRLGDNDALPARMTVVLLNPLSQHTEAAVRFLLFADAQNAHGYAPALYQAFDRDALIRQGLEEDIAAQIFQGDEQWVIDALQAKLEAGNFTDDDYQYSQADIACYRKNALPYLVFPTVTFLDTRSAQQQYLTGKTDVEGLIAALNAALEAAR